MFLSRLSTPEQTADVGWCSFENPPSLEPALIAVFAVMASFTIPITTGRLYVNRNGFKLADYFTIVGLIFDLGFSGVSFAASRYFREDWRDPSCWINISYAKFVFVQSLIVGPTFFFPKASIFLFYLQIFSAKKSVRIGSKLGLAMSALLYSATSLILCQFIAPHIGQSWEDAPLSETATKSILVVVIVSIVYVIMEMYIFVLPLPTIWSLNMPFSKRMQLVALFATASLAIVASVLGLVLRIGILHFDDAGWRLGNTYITIIVENNISLIVGSLPAFSSLVRIYLANSALYQSLRSKLSWNRSGRISKLEQRESGQRRRQWTYGSPSKRQPQFHELSDSALLESRITVPEHAITADQMGGQGIVRTVGFSQEVHTYESLERLI
ncbi:hypothetical protein GGR54DRAFT_393506 [Hypoxylon sp. NC1633]|nr:hypothetical protein GGR54DRAFT_393506 [Hypoxylon sp. NC1633]